MAPRVWERVAIELDSGDTAEGVAPLIVSASRSTDIPAFYGQWFVERLRRGYASWVNPFSGQVQHVSFSRTRAVAFWTKNPRPFLPLLHDVGRFVPNYYVLFTLNDYEREALEPGVPPLEQRVSTFLELAHRIGPERVVWRFDPLVLSDTLTVDELAERVNSLAARLEGATRRLVVSFVDIERYPKVKRNLARAGSSAREFTCGEKRAFASRVAEPLRTRGIQVQTCAEEIDLTEYGITPGACIDGALLRRLFGSDAVPEDLPKDKGQRSLCRCVASKDIGRYDTCPHLCAYCYANSSPQAVARSREQMGAGFPAVLGPRPDSCSRCGMCG